MSITRYSNPPFRFLLGVQQGDRSYAMSLFLTVCPSGTWLNILLYFQGNFHHWRPLFLHFDTYFKTYLSARKDLLLTDNIIEDDIPFPKQSVLQILRVMRIILENCHNKGSFSGLEVCFYIYSKSVKCSSLKRASVFFFSISSYYLHQLIPRFSLPPWRHSQH